MALNLSDIDREAAMMMVRHGRGDKARLIPVGEPAVYALGQWRELAPRGESLNAIFLNFRGGRRLTSRGAQLIVNGRAAQASIQNRVTPHTFRHSFATHNAPGRGTFEAGLRMGPSAGREATSGTVSTAGARWRIATNSKS